MVKLWDNRFIWSGEMRDVLAEIERRENLARIPDQITELKHKYAELGGDPTNLE